MKKSKKIKIVCLILSALLCITVVVVKVIFIKEVSRFDANCDFNKPEFWSFSKESFIDWSKDEGIKKKYDISGVEEDLKDLDDDQRLMVSFGREISFFYRIRPFEPVEVKYKNDKLTNKVYVYKINYGGPIIDYTIY